MKSGLAFIVALLMSSAALAATPSEDVAAYIKVIQGDKSQHHTISEELQWKGMSDPLLFDIIEAKVKSEYETAKYDSTEKNRVARYILELGYSLICRA